MPTSRLFFSAALLLVPTAALADDADDAAGLWMTPTAEFALDDDTAVEVEASVRLRSAAVGPDSYLVRLWLNQQLSDAISVSGGIERRVNSGAAANEIRLLQQASARTGIVRGRVRFEQRFIDGAGQTALRLRTRLGVNVPLDTARNWRAVADAESFWTLQPALVGGQTGLTGLRTRIGGSHRVKDNFTLGVYYLRNQEILQGRRDRVTHAPLIGLDFSF